MAARKGFTTENLQMSQMKRLSHSSADKFDTCPMSYYRQYIVKDVPYLETEATTWGTRVHTAMEDFVNGKADVLTELMMDDIRPVASYIKDFPADHKACETEFCFNTSGQMCAPDDHSAMYIGYIDFEAVRGDKAWVIDFKTGKRHSKFEQVELYALSIWLRYPEVNQINTGYMWLKERDPQQFLTFKTLYRSTDMQRIWNYRVAQWQRIYAAHETGVFNAKPGKGRAKFPCGWCSANKVGCDWANVEYMAK